MRRRREQIAGSFSHETADCLRVYAGSIDRSLADTIRIIVEEYLLKKGLLNKQKNMY